MKKILIAFTGVLFLLGCENKKEKEMLLAQLDSIKIEQEKGLYALQLIDLAGQYLDSVDANRNWVKIDLEKGTSEEDFVERMKNLNLYVQKAEWTIGELEKTRSGYASQVKRLKKELDAKNATITDLQNQMQMIENENTSLKGQLSLTHDDLIATVSQLDARSSELSQSNVKIQQILEQSRTTEAEAYFARGEAMEEVAARTQLAPKKKKQALEEAMAHYQKSMELGNSSAQAKVDDLEEKLKLD